MASTFLASELAPARAIRLALAFGSFWIAAPRGEAADESVATFDRVAGIVEFNCVSCHGPTKAKSGLRLDSAEGIRAGGAGGPIVSPGDPDASALVRAIRYDGDPRMPPDGRLPQEDIDAIVEWVKAGAPTPGAPPHDSETGDAGAAGADGEPDFAAVAAERRAAHWAYRPVGRPEPPPVRRADWPRNPIDNFVLARLEAEGIDPSPEADRRALVRRLHFDLTGLPPSPEVADAFVADPRPDAYERLVDRLLASPEYGERWARHWLDVVRFAETNGFETNTPRPNAWPYRDWTIRAFAEDMPYDRFVLAQLAGDGIGDDAATGYLVAGAWDEVKSPDEVLTKNQRADELHDMVSTTGAAFLGLTVGCARCHDHKFDPVSQTDYYRMQAIFAGVRHGEREMRGPDHEERRAESGRLKGILAAAETRLEAFEIPARPEAGIPGVASTLARGLRPPVSPVRNVERIAPVRARFVRFAVLATNTVEPCLDELEVFSAEVPPRNVALAAFGGKATASSEYPNSEIHRIVHVNDGRHGNANSWISREPGGGWIAIELAEETTIDRIVWGRDREGNFKDRLATRYRVEVATAGPDGAPGPWRLVASSADRAPYDPDAPAVAAPSPAGLSPVEAEELLTLAIARKALADRVAELDRAPRVYAGKFERPEPTRLLRRGDPMQPLDEVEPGAVEGIGGPLDLRPDAPEAERRHALAKWIASPDNPLAARVLVNRLWHWHFGRGIVATPSDFGAMGAPPTHPELLDWLASEFVAGGWRIKPIHRLIALSSAYRQSSAPRPEAVARDAGTTLLWRFPPRRLEAEAIRDAILATTGALNPERGGPGFDTFEPNNNYVRVYKPKTAFGPAEWRRAIYRFQPRMEVDPTFGVFDCPDGGQPAPRRTISTTPLQALNLFNSPFAREQSEIFAERLEREAGPEAAAKARGAFRLAFGRDPDGEELTRSVEAIAALGTTGFCRAVLNANEFVYLE